MDDLLRDSVYYPASRTDFEIRITLNIFAIGSDKFISRYE